MTENKRIIKFRGKRRDNGEWMYGLLIYGYGDYCAIRGWMGVSGGEEYATVEVIGETVGQFTGLLDRKGAEIYEDDIVRYAFDWDYADKEYKVREFKKGKKAGNYIGQVEWEGEEYAHFVINPKRMNLSTTSCLVEIIGTRYENPELIKS